MAKKADLYNRKQWLWLVYQYRSGHSYGEIANFVGMNYHTARRKLEALGALPETRYKYEKFRPDPPPLETRRREFNNIGE